MYHVISLSSLDEIWKKLESQFMLKTLTNKLYLKQKLYGLKMQEGNDLAQHVNIFNQINTNLAQLDVKIEDEDRAIIMLCSLPSSYEHIVKPLRMGKKQSRLRRLLQCCWHTTNESTMQGRVLLKVTVYTLRVARNVEEAREGWFWKTKF